MPIRTSMGLRWVLASVAALVAAAAACPPALAIVGGSNASLIDHPYQVALLNNARGAATSSQYCGGSIRDALHIITAAHCVYNTPFSPGVVAEPTQIDVLAGTENLATESAGERPHVSAISYDPEYDDGQKLHDAAVLTLAQPLVLGSKVQPVQVIGAADGGVAVNDAVFVSGWGDTDPNSNAASDFPDLLQGVTVNVMSDAQCDAKYFPYGIDEASELCAAATGRDACYGDSGGPLVKQFGAGAADDRLVGIVSWGTSCADPHFPGVYTEVSEPSIRTFVTQANPMAAPVNQSPPTLSSATATVGQPLTCSPGAWTGSPSFSYQFVRSTAAGDVGIASTGPASYTVAAADAGTALRCVVTATNAGGTGVAQSASTATIPGINKNPPTNSLDKTAPVAKVIKAKCTATRCVLTVTVTDAGYSAGIKTVLASVTSTYRGTCTRKGRKVHCTKHRTKKLSAKKLASKKFQVVASKLPIGKQVFTLYAVDKANHRQHLPTRKTVRTKRATKRR